MFVLLLIFYHLRRENVYKSRKKTRQNQWIASFIKRLKNIELGEKYGNSNTTPVKILEGKKIGEKIIYIEGIHCQNCKNSIERQINKINGAVANVILDKKIAYIDISREISDEQIIKVIEKLDFDVIKIENRRLYLE